MQNALLVVLAIGLVVSVVALVATIRRLAEAREAKGLAEGAAASSKTQIDSQSAQIQGLTAQLMQAQTDAATAEEAAKGLREQLEKEKELIEQARAQLTDTFKALASEALTSSTTEFRAQAEESMKRLYAAAQQQLGERQEQIGKIMEPLSVAIGTYQTQVREMADKHLQAEAAVGEQVKMLSDLQRSLTDETRGLVTVLRGGTSVRGKWGEMTLRRVVELAGMSELCDFEEQVSTTGTEGGRQRPDMVIHLPEDRDIVVDAKAPMEAYLQAMDATDDATRAEGLKRHARHVRDHITQLATRDYTAQFEHAPDVTVCFLPAEALFCAALEADHELMQFAMEKRVLLATPFTLFALLKAVAASWQQVRILKNAQEIADRSKVLFDRLRPFANHMARVGTGLRQAAGAYNDAVGSWQSRVMPQERAVREMINLKEGLPELAEVGEDLSHLPPAEGVEVEGEDEGKVELEGGD